MSDLWERWRKHYKKLGVDPKAICEDGILNEKKYGEAGRTGERIVFVLKETDRYAESLRKLLADGPYRMWHTVARWAAGLLWGFPPYDEIDDRGKMKEALSGVAAVNLKKATGKARSNPKEIGRFVRRDRPLLMEQLKRIKPTILVACGTFRWTIELLHLEVADRSLGDAPAWADSLGAWVIPMRHPNRADNRATYRRLKRLYQQVPRARKKGQNA